MIIKLALHCTLYTVQALYPEYSTRKTSQNFGLPIFNSNNKKKHKRAQVKRFYLLRFLGLASISGGVEYRLGKCTLRTALLCNPSIKIH